MRGKTAEDHRLLELLDPVADAAGYQIVRLRLMGGDAARRLQVMAEDADGSMLVEDCARLARALSAVMDDADPIAGEYLLEVSSPGVDRPLTRLSDFEAWKGFTARIEVDRMIEGRKRFKGEIDGVEDEQVALSLEDEADLSALIPFAWMTDAKLVVTDQLLEAGAKARAERLARQDNTLSKEDTP